MRDRLVREFRLEGISSIEDADVFTPRFINDCNNRFSKEPRNSHSAHRAIRDDEDLGSIFSWQELRKITKALTLHYERKRYMLADADINQGLIGKYLEFFQYPNAASRCGQGQSHSPTPCTTNWAPWTTGAIVDNMRLSHVLQISQEV